jgi:hypothetical protein
VYVPVHRTPAPWAAEAVAVIPLTTDHGGLSIGTYLISHCGRHVVQDRKASVSSPPIGSSTNGSISADPGEPQTSPVYPILVQRNRVVTKQRSRRCSAAGINGAMLVAGRAVDRRLEPKCRDFAKGGEGQWMEHLRG